MAVEYFQRHNYTSLMKAAEHGHTEVTKLLLKYKTRTEDVDVCKTYYLIKYNSFYYFNK